MGLFDFLGGGSETKSSSLQDVDLTKKSTQTTTQEQITEGLRTGEVSGETQQKATTLDAGTLAILQSLIQQIGGTGAETGLPTSLQAVDEPLDFARFLSSRAIGTEDVISENVSAIVDEARRTGEQKLTAQGTQLAEAGGSALNTVNAAIQGRSRGDLESQLASIEAELSIRGRELGSRDLSTAFAALTEGLQTGANVSLAGSAAPIQEIVALVNALKGGETEAAGTSKEQSTEEQFISTLSELISKLTETQKGTVSTTGSSTTENSPGIIDIIGAVAPFFAPTP